MSVGIPLFGSLAVPDDRLFIVLRDTFTFGIEVAEYRLSVNLALFGGLAEPEERLFGVLRDTFTFEIEEAEVELGRDIALFSHALDSRKILSSLHIARQLQ